MLGKYRENVQDYPFPLLICIDVKFYDFFVSLHLALEKLDPLLSDWGAFYLLQPPTLPQYRLSYTFPWFALPIFFCPPALVFPESVISFLTFAFSAFVSFDLIPVCRNFEILHNVVNMTSFVKVFLAPSDMNGLIFGLKLDIVELYRLSDFQSYRAATSWNLKFFI